MKEPYLLIFVLSFAHLSQANDCSLGKIKCMNNYLFCNKAVITASEQVGAQWGCWSDWSSCSLTCGGPGTRTRSGVCQPGKVIDSNQDVDCEGDGNESETCEEGACPIPTEPTSASWSQWNTWSTCSVTCNGPGTRMRMRSCNPDLGQGNAQSIICLGDSKETESCGDIDCPGAKHCPPGFQYSIDSACYFVSQEQVTLAEAEVKCAIMSGSRLTSLIDSRELDTLVSGLPLTFDHWIGLYRGKAETDPIVVGDGRRSLAESDFVKLQSNNSPDRSTCPDCNCVIVDVNQKLKFTECREQHYFICELKG